MCGRYAFFSPAEAVKRIFALDDVPEPSSMLALAGLGALALRRRASRVR